MSAVLRNRNRIGQIERGFNRASLLAPVGVIASVSGHVCRGNRQSPQYDALGLGRIFHRESDAHRRVVDADGPRRSAADFLRLPLRSLRLLARTALQGRAVYGRTLPRFVRFSWCIWYPVDREGHSFLNRSVLTCSQGTTWEGFCSCWLIR